jgi:lipopolysaccharide transport system permease protein
VLKVKEKYRYESVLKMSLSIAQRFARNLMAGLLGPFHLLMEHRGLLRILVKRDIVSRTSGTLLGGLWMLAQPALQVLAFWFLLDFVLRVRFPGQVSFVNYFLLGMLPWLMISEIIQRNLMVLSEFSALYQRSVFPVKILPLLPMIISGMIYGIIYGVVVGLMEGMEAVLWVPPLIAMLLLWLLPVCYLMAVFGLFIRDLRHVVPFLLTLTLYLTPIMYMPQMLPKPMQGWMLLNPFADWMAIIHGLVQGMPITVGNIIRPLLIWLLLLAPAWALFRRSEPHVREQL